MKKNKIIFAVVRHLRDENALRSFGHNGPLVPGQEDILNQTADEIIKVMEEEQKTSVRILYTEKTRRIKETADILCEKMTQRGIAVIMQHEKRMEVMDQGDLVLPENYKDGEWFTPLDKAWDAICDEAYLYDNIFYSFGDAKGKNQSYPELANAFSRTGQSMGWTLINKYSLICDILRSNIGLKENEFLVIACQSDLPLILIELQKLCGDPDVNSTNLPEKCWTVYKKGGLQDEFGYDIPMGYTKIYDLSELRDCGFVKIIDGARAFLEQKSQ